MNEICAIWQKARKFTVIMGSLLVFCAQAELYLDPSRPFSEYVHSRWQSFDGRSFPGVFGAVQDERGLIWLATYEGVLTFNGVEFLSPLALKGDVAFSGHINTIAIAGDQSVWFTSANQGVGRVKDNQFSHFGLEQGLLTLRAKVVASPGGQLWYFSNKGVGKFDNGRFVTVLDKPVSKLVFISDKAFWYVSANKVYRFSDGHSQLWQNNTELEVVDHSVILDIDGEHALSGTWRTGIMQIKNGQVQRHKAFEALNNDTITHLLKGKDDSLWIGTYRGVFRYYQGQLKQFDFALDKTGGARVKAMFFDREQALWVGFYSKGLHRLAEPGVNIISHGLPGQDGVRSVAEFENGYWLGTALNGLVVRYHDGRSEHFHQGNGLPGNIVYALAADGLGNLWIGTEKGLVRYSQGKFEFLALPSQVSNPWVMSLYVDSDDSLWIGTRSGLVHLQQGEFSFNKIDNAYGERFVHTVYWISRTREGTLWVGTHAGVFNRNGDSWSSPAMPELAKGEISAFLQSQDGSLWFGSRTGAGLYWLEQGELRRFSTEHGLFDNYIWSINEDEQGQFWMSSDRGISIVKRQQLQQWNGTALIKGTLLGAQDGLYASECNSGATTAARTGADSFLFACMVGAVEVPIDRSEYGEASIYSVIDYMLVDGKKVDLSAASKPAKAFILAADKRDFILNFGAINFYNADKTQFRYRLEGYHQGWVDNGRSRQVAFTNLDAGDYSFELNARAYDGDWSPQLARFYFRIEPKFSETWYFWGLWLVLLVGSGYWYMRWRLHLALQRKSVIEQAKLEHLNTLVSGIAHNLNTPIGSAITSVTVLQHKQTAFESIIEQRKVTKRAMDEYVEVNRQAHALIDSSLKRSAEIIDMFKKINIDNYSEDRVTFDLKDILETLKFEIAHLYPDKKIQWLEQTHGSMPMDSYPGVIHQILSSLIDNTVKHGYVDGEQVQIRLTYEKQGRCLKLHYQDFGCGISKQQYTTLFVPFSKDISDGSGLGLGMSIVYNLVTQKLGGRIYKVNHDEQGVYFVIELAHVQK